MTEYFYDYLVKDWSNRQTVRVMASTEPEAWAIACSTANGPSNIKWFKNISKESYYEIIGLTL